MESDFLTFWSSNVPHQIRTCKGPWRIMRHNLINVQIRFYLEVGNYNGLQLRGQNFVGAVSKQIYLIF